MRVLFAYRYGVLGGVGTQLINRLAGFGAQADVEVHLAFLRDHGISASLAHHPHVVFLGEPDALAPYGRRHGIDVVSVIDTPEVLEPARAIPGARVVLEVHTTYAAGLRGLADAASRVDAVIVPSRYSEALVRSRVAAATRVLHVPNCVDPDRFRPRTCEPPAAPIVLWVGKLDDHKNWRGFLALAAEVGARRPDARFWLVGGRTAPDPVKVALRDEIRRLRLEDRLDWTEWVPYGSMPDLYAIAAASGGVHVVTSRDESFGMSVAEALLCGCPVVAGDVGALAELAIEEPALHLHPPGRTDRAARLVEEVLAAGPAPLEARRRRHLALAARVAPSRVCRAFRDAVERL